MSLPASRRSATLPLHAIDRPQLARSIATAMSLMVLIVGTSAGADPTTAAAYSKQEAAIIAKTSKMLARNTRERLDAIVQHQTDQLMRQVREMTVKRAALRQTVAHRVEAQLKRQEPERTAIARR